MKTKVNGSGDEAVEKKGDEATEKQGNVGTGDEAVENKGDVEPGDEVVEIKNKNPDYVQDVFDFNSAVNVLYATDDNQVFESKSNAKYHVTFLSVKDIKTYFR